MIPAIETKRLTLRSLSKDDAGQIYKIFSDPEVCRYWSSEVMTAMEDARTFIEQVISGMKDHSLLEWGIILKDSRELIGVCAYSGWNKKHHTAEIGFALRREQWGKGLMKEFLPHFIDFGFNELDLHRIQADVDPRNSASVSLLEQLDFRREGLLRECYRLNNEIQDALILGLLKPEFGS